MEMADLLNNNLYSFGSVILVCTLLTLLALLFILPKKSRPGTPPSPPRLPIIGNLHQLTTRPNHALQSLAKKYGPVILLHVGPHPIYVVSSAEIAREITRNQEANFPVRPKSWAGDVLFSGGTDLIFSPYGHYWRQARKLCVNELLSVKRVQSWQYIREEEVGIMVEKIRVSCLHKNRSAIDLSKMLLFLANKIVSRAVVGEKYIGEEDLSEIIGKLARQASEQLSTFSFRDYVPSLAWMDNVTGFAQRVKKTSQALDSFINRVIDEHESKSAEADEKDDRKDFVDIILQFQMADMIGLDLTRANIKAILLDMFVGGTDTSGATMEWMMAELLKNRRTMKKVQEEIRNIVGDKSKIEEQDINKMEYFQCAVKETLRLHGVLTLGRVPTDTITVGGFEILAKTTVLMNTWAIHRDPELWDRPLEFLPERFLGSSLGYKGQDDDYFPFGLGRRICPGAQFAVTEVEYTIANLLCWFDWELPDGMAPEDLDMTDTFAQVPSKKFPLRVVPKPVMQTT